MRDDAADHGLHQDPAGGGQEERGAAAGHPAARQVTARAVTNLREGRLSGFLLNNLHNREETNNSVFEYYSNNIRILTIRIRIRPFFRNE